MIITSALLAAHVFGLDKVEYRLPWLYEDRQVYAAIYHERGEYRNDGYDLKLKIKHKRKSAFSVTFGDYSYTELALVVRRGKGFLVIANLYRVPQGWLISDSGKVKKLEWSFCHRDGDMSFSNRTVLFNVELPYADYPEDGPIRSLAILDVATLKIQSAVILKKGPAYVAPRVKL